MLRPSADALSDSLAADLRTRTDKAISSSCATITESFIHQEPMSFLIPQNVNAATKALMRITESAAELSYKLWARRNHIIVAGLHQSEISEYLAGSNFVDHHALHNNQLEGDPNALDGKPILLMLSPTVAVCGTGDGRNFDTRRIWKKSIAFMGLPED